MLRFETRRVSREMRGRTNASVNADAANLARAAAARLRSPEATLAELAVRLVTTKWVVRQRLRRVTREAAR